MLIVAHWVIVLAFKLTEVAGKIVGLVVISLDLLNYQDMFMFIDA